jgi:hypothetical protein
MEVLGMICAKAADARSAPAKTCRTKQDAERRGLRESPITAERSEAAPVFQEALGVVRVLIRRRTASTEGAFPVIRCS